MAYLDLAVDYSSETAQLLEATEQKWGYIPDIVQAFALHPPMLEAEDHWTTTLMHEGLLDRGLKEAVATTVSSVNECAYCATSHAYQALQHGVTRETVQACRSLDFTQWEGSPADEAAIAFARKAAGDIHSVDKTDIDGLQEHFSPTEIVELVLVVASYELYNTFATVLGLDVEAPLLEHLATHNGETTP